MVLEWIDLCLFNYPSMSLSQESMDVNYLERGLAHLSELRRGHLKVVAHTVKPNIWEAGGGDQRPVRIDLRA